MEGERSPAQVYALVIGATLTVAGVVGFFYNADFGSGSGTPRDAVLGIVHNRAIDALRRGGAHERRREEFEGVEERHEARERTDVEAARREEARSVRSALDTLPADQRRTIELAYFGGFSHSQIAELLDEPIGTIKGRMRLGLGKLRDQLADLVTGEFA
jgi:RNA polymerase sigma-70 factor (ECF subfamily)